jgi:hypothetical protein
MVLLIMLGGVAAFLGVFSLVGGTVGSFLFGCGALAASLALLWGAMKLGRRDRTDVEP